MASPRQRVGTAGTLVVAAIVLPPVRGIAEHTAALGAVDPLYWRSAHGAEPPVVYVHGVPDSSDVWLPFLERTGGVAPDLPGFGRSAKRADLDYSIAGYDRFVEAFVDHLGLERFSLVVHDWGAAALATAQRMPERLHRLVVINAVPFSAEYRWHWVARVWRTRLLGELAMGTTTRWSARLLTRQANVTPGPLPPDRIDSIWEHFDQGTQRAILRLYRSSPPDVLGRAGRELERIDCPALVIWGEQDPYLPVRFAEQLATRLPRARLRRVPDAGHWPWLDRPELVAEAADFVA
jgi:pimeloyl-ACP methyl ester carboxylesterase